MNPTALDSWILRDQKLVLTHNWDTKDEIVTMIFTNFTAEIFVKFSQDVVPSTKSYNQALVVQDGIIKFVPMNSTDTFMARDTIGLRRVQTLLRKIIEQELNFLNQLNSFKELLQSAGVISEDISIAK